MLSPFARPTILCFILPPLAMALCGCRRDSDDVVEDADKSVRSWAATVDVAADEHSRGRAPGVYMGQLADAAREALDEQHKSLEKVPPADPRRSRLEAQITSVRRRVDDLARGQGSPRP